MIWFPLLGYFKVYIIKVNTGGSKGNTKFGLIWGFCNSFFSASPLLNLHRGDTPVDCIIKYKGRLKRGFGWS